MTRETKIGLLVGLAFIIVVGILLSDHMTAATERPSAALAEAGRGVQAGVSAPGAAPAVAPPIELPAPVVQGPPAVAPGVAQVAIVPPTPQSPIVIQQQAPAPLPVEFGPQFTQVPPVQQQQPNALAPIITRTPGNGGHSDPFANGELVLTARLGGEPLVPVTPTATTATPPAVTPVAANNAREYKAQPGDTLSRIAALLPGGATKANRDAVVQLNPTLQKDPNKVISGRTYLLPTTLATVPAPAPAAIVQTASPVEPKTVAKADQSEKAEKPAAKADAGTRVYVVQKGDTLGRIAVAQLGSAKLVSAILELNKDVLRDGNHIRADMKLKLPVKVG
jgi:LysM repeat protein